MTARTEARAHLAKAREFMDAAVLSNEMGLFSAATSDAVVSGINSKDAICLALAGRTQKSDSHTLAVADLKAAGPAGARLAAPLGRLLRLKTKSQYLPTAIAATDAGKALEWAQRLLDGAEQVVSNR